MDLNARTLKSLEWERFKLFLQDECSCDTSRELACKLGFLDEVSAIEFMLRQNSEALSLLLDGIDLHQESLPDLESVFARLQTGASLSARELLALRTMMMMSRKLKIILSNLCSESYPLLKKMHQTLTVFDDLVAAIDIVIDESAEVKDDASPALFKIKRELQRLNNRVKDELQKIINSPTHSKCLQEPLYTLRNGRHVLPVLANMRHSIEGIVHDSSSSGLTVYIEPKSVVELTNTIRINEAEIEREIDRLLWELSAAAHEKLDSLKDSFHTLVSADLLAAKASLARKYEGNCPRISRTLELSLLKARHPLLILQSGNIDTVIANDIRLESKLNTLIITGPNTGGKTVYLKTAGLLSLMLKAGLLLPCAAGSATPVFKKVFADIGDEQSLEQNLSTFSSHMSNIIEITEKAESGTLVLLDEIGAGTDPREGVILARVILSKLSESGALTICSTHYGDLKTLAHANDAYTNASMDFDDRSLTPSYRLRLGIAGNSRAIAVAARLGLSEELIKKAQALLDSEKQDFERKVDELEIRLRLLQEQEEDLEKRKTKLQELEFQLEQRASLLAKEEKKSREVQAGRLLIDYQNAKKAINELTAALQKTPSLARAQEAKEKLEQIKKELDWGSDAPGQKINKVLAGQKVKVISLGQTGIVEAAPAENSEEVQVRVGRLKVKVSLKDLESTDEAPFNLKSKAVAFKEKTKNKAREVQDPIFVRSDLNTLDLRGKRVDEGLALLERFLDESYLAQLSPLMVIHGHGTGAMKQAVRDYLADCSYKNKARPGENYEGGDGVTVINFT